MGETWGTHWRMGPELSRQNFPTDGKEQVEENNPRLANHTKSPLCLLCEY